MGVNKLPKFGLKRFEIGCLLRLGHQFGDERFTHGLGFLQFSDKHVAQAEFLNLGG
jgi:hypothetical protein